MTDQTIGVAEPGTPTKLLQSYQNTVSSQTVQAEGVVQVDLNGKPVAIIENTALTGNPIPTLAAKANSLAPSWTSGNYVPLSVTTTGNLRVSQQGALTVTANQGTAGASIWPILAYADSSAAPGTNAETQVDTNSFVAQGLRPLYVESLGTLGVALKQDPADNSTLIGMGDFTIGGNVLTNAGDVVTQTAQGKGTLFFDFLGTFTGSPNIVFEAQNGSAAWAGQYIYDLVNRKWITSLAPVTGQHYFLITENGGYSQFRARLIVSCTSGNIAVTFNAGGQTRNVLRNLSAPGQPLPPEAALIGGSDGTNIQAISTNSSGQLAIQNPSNLPALNLDPQGSLQVNSNNLRAVEERIMMLAELAAVNSLIASDNGPGARNYQELR